MNGLVEVVLGKRKVLSVMGRDDSWHATVPSVVPIGDCSHWSIHYIHLANRPISVWMGEVPTQKHSKRQTVLPIANLMADSESGNPSSYLRFIVTVGLSHLVSEIFVCDRQTDNADHYYSWPPHCGVPANPHLFAYMLCCYETILHLVLCFSRVQIPVFPTLPESHLMCIVLSVA